jgi:hypothetical protein
VHAKRATFLVLSDGLNHRPEDVRVDLRPVETADMEEVGAGDLAEAWRVHAAGEKLAVHMSAQRGIPALARSSCFVFMARNNSPITSWVLDESLALIRATVLVNRPIP